VRLSTTLRAVTPPATKGQAARQRSASSGVPPTASPGRSSRAAFPPRGTLRKHGTATALDRGFAPQRVVRETSPVQAGHSECPGSARLAPGKPRQEAGQLPVPLARVAPPGVATLLSKTPHPHHPTDRECASGSLREPPSHTLSSDTHRQSRASRSAAPPAIPRTAYPDRSPRGRSTFIKTHPSVAPLQWCSAGTPHSKNGRYAPSRRGGRPRQGRFPPQFSPFGIPLS
jgi:hypothetical protein